MNTEIGLQNRDITKMIKSKYVRKNMKYHHNKLIQWITKKTTT